MENNGFDKEGEDAFPNKMGRNDADRRSLSAASQESLIVHKTFAQKFREYPKCIFFIFGNEFCERFSYYGMLAVLTLYAINYLGFSETRATTMYNGFSALCYFTPILGCVLADGYIGKFHTILWVSLLYACGNILVAVASAVNQHSKLHPGLDILGLVIIGFGTGGIKPCVVAFGGDQFKKGQERWLETFFSIFYFAINAGGCISTFITPIFRTRHCLGQPSCYPLAFGVPAGLMIVSCCFFIFGSFWYRKIPPKENILAIVAKVTFRALRNKRVFSVQRDHWLDHYLDDHSCDYDPKCRELGSCEKKQFCTDLAAVYRLLIMYIPTPFYWALYNQQGSTWIIQGTEMNGRLGSINLLPDQVPTINPILIMSFIPIFSGIVYPIFAKCFKVTPLRKMSVGGLMAALAYVVTGFVQLAVNKSLPQIPVHGNSSLVFINYEPCNITVDVFSEMQNYTFDVGRYVDGSSQEDYKSPKLQLPGTTDGYDVRWSIKKQSANDTCNLPTTISNGTFVSEKAYYAPVAGGYANSFPEALRKPSQGQGQCLYSFNWYLPNYDILPEGNFTEIYLCAPSHQHYNDCISSNDPDKFVRVGINSWNSSAFVELRPDRLWFAYLPTPDGQVPGFPHEPSFNFTFSKQGSIETMTITGNSDTEYDFHTYELTVENGVNILWQMPQYIIATASEILFSITGLEFTYSQAPLTMKSVMQAVWLITTAIGNVIIIIIVDAQIFPNMAYTFFLFAAIMVAVMIVFIGLSIFYYEYVYFIRDEDDGEGSEEVKNPLDEKA